jgi:hypothetical protein
MKSPAKTAKANTFFWRGVPPQSFPERHATAADLENLLLDPAITYEKLTRCLVTGMYVLSGKELERVLCGLVILITGRNPAFHPLHQPNTDSLFSRQTIDQPTLEETMCRSCGVCGHLAIRCLVCGGTHRGGHEG